MLSCPHSPTRFDTRIPVFLVAVASLSCASTAENVDWLCPQGGIWEDATCWSTGSVPDFADSAVFNLGETYKLIATTDLQSVDLMSIDDDLSFAIDAGDSAYNQFFPTSLEIGFLDTETEAAFRLLKGEVFTDSVYLGGTASDSATIQLMAGTSLWIYDGVLFADSAVFEFDIARNTQSTVVRLYSPDVYLGGTLVASHGDELANLGDISLFNSTYAIYEPFAAVVTDPPPGRDYVISGNDFGSYEITVTVVEAPTIPVADVDSLQSYSNSAIAIETGDMNGDLIDDIIVLLPGNTKDPNGKMRIYENDGNGGYSSYYDYELDSDPVDLAIGDFDGDLSNDVAVIDQSLSELWVYLNPFNSPAALDSPVISSTVDSEGGAEPSVIVTCNLGEETEGVAFVGRNTDVVVASKGGGGGARATGYRSNGSGGIIKMASFGIEDDPGPGNSDDDDDEEEKDDDTNVGIGHGGASGFTSGSSSSGSLTFIRTQEDFPWMTLVTNVPQSSPPAAIAFGNLDGNSFTNSEMVVGLENGLIRSYSDTGDNLWQYQLSSSLTGIATGDLDNSSADFDDIIASVERDGQNTVVLLSNQGVTNEIQLQVGGEFQTGESRVVGNGLASGQLYNFLSTSLFGLAAITDSSPDTNPEIVSGLYERVPTPACLAANFDGSGDIDGGDLGLLMAAWGSCSGCPEDLNGDGEVNGEDLGLFLTLWGPCEL